MLHPPRILPLNKSSRLLNFFVLLLALSVPSFACASTRGSVTSIRHWSNPDYTRVVIDLTKRSTYKYHLLKKDPSIGKPRRFFVDIAGASVSGKLKREIPVNDGLLLSIRSAQPSRSTVRVVIDLESIESYKVFSLDNPFRIIIDISGRHGATAVTAPHRATAVPPSAKKAGPPAPSLRHHAVRKKKRLVIVVDPGHGGKDPGAIGRRGLREKDVTLRIAKLVARDLSRKLRSRVILTRKRDVYVPLEERTAIANSRDADIFVSIHINSSPRRSASGVETYILNLSASEESRRLAARENSTTRRGVSDLEFILRDLVKTARTNDSVRLASKVQGDLVRRLRAKYSRIRGNGVKGAPFYVLVGTRMPSVLVEVSFISNSREEKRLRSAKYLREVAAGISSGVIDYVRATS